MSELISKQDHRNFRWHLLTTVSALSLMVSISANASEADKPTVWIELGGQLERIGGREDAFLPPFTTQSPAPNAFMPISPTEAQKAPIYSYGFEGQISLRPHGSEWSFTADIRYGRSSNNKHVHQQSYASVTFPSPFKPGQTGSFKEALFGDFKTINEGSHSIVDFEVGRDVGVGMISSTANLGVRVASLVSHSNTGSIARPDAGFYIRKQGRFYLYRPAHTDYMASAYNERSFRGVGPTVSWNGDVAVLGNEDSAVTVDWGVNAAVLFGRQKAKGSHSTIARYYKGLLTGTPPPGVSLVYDHPNLPHNRSRSVVVPNVGFLGGISLRFPNAKVSLGYRADMFFGAMDMGIDQVDTKDRVFHGPFATIGIGLGG